MTDPINDEYEEERATIEELVITGVLVVIMILVVVFA